MQLQVKGKGVSVTDALFQHAEQKLERLAKVLPPWDDATSVELELSVERNPKIAQDHIAEVTVRTKGPVLRAREAADDMYVAIDVAARKLERQARRYRDRRRDQRGRAPLDQVPELVGESATLEPTAPPDRALAPDSEPVPRLVKSKTFALRPMTPEDAALHMEMLDHDFYVFRNEADDQVNVVYRRRDGDVGLIAPGE